MREAESLSDLGETYSKVRINFKAPRGTQRAAVVRVKALNARTGNWEHVTLPPEHRRRLAGIGIGVVAEEAESAISSWLQPPTQLDKLAELAKVLLAPDTLVPKILGVLTESVARHAGMPDAVATWAGAAVEQAASPLFEPEGARSALLAGMDSFTVISDLDSGQVTSAVAGIALNRLADELKKRLAAVKQEP